MRRHVEIFLKFTRATGHPHPHLPDAEAYYTELLQEMGLSEHEILAKRDELHACVLGLKVSLPPTRE